MNDTRQIAEQDRADPHVPDVSGTQGVFRLDGDGRVVYVDQRAAEILGYAPEDLTGRHSSELFCESELAQAQQKFAQRRLGVGGVGEYRVQRKDGTAKWIAVASVPTHDADGVFFGVTGFVTDIEERKRQQAMTSHESRLLRQLAANYPLSTVLEDLCLTLETVARQPLYAAVMLADGKLLKCVAAPSLPPRFRADRAIIRLDEDASPCSVAVRSGRAVVICDTLQAGAAECCFYGFGAVWSYPIIQDEESLGTLALFLPTPGEPGAEDARTVEFALQVARLALTHERKANALRASEQRFRDYAELSADWYWEQDADFRFTHMSGGAFNKGNFRVADSLGKTRWELPIEGVSETHWAEHRALLERREVFHDFAYVIHTADGSLRWYSVSGKPVFGSGGEFVGYRGIGRDITEQVRSRENLERALHWLEQAVRSTGIGLWERDIETWTFSFRDNWRALFGYAADEIEDSAEEFDRLVHPDDLARIHAAGRAYIENPGSEYETRFRIRHKGGSWRWVLSRGNLLIDSVTGMRTFIGCHLDITEQNHSEIALRDSERLLREVLELLPVGVWVMDGTGNIVRSNEAGRRIWAGAHYVGIEQFGEYKGWWLGSGKRIEAEEWAGARVILKGETSIDEEIEIECFDGTRKIILNSAVPIKDEAGAICGGIAVNQDITVRWHAEQKVRELAATLETRVKARTATLEEANHELDAFNYSVSHDLRTPLRAIEGFSRALLEDCQESLDATGREHLRRICRSTTRMGELIDALYELSRLARGPLRIGPVDLSVMARDLVVELRDQDPQRAVVIDIAETPLAEGDAPLLRIVLANLLDNAWKFTGKTTPARIVFDAQRDADDRVVYSVWDNGAGFDMRFADKLFRAFHRLHRDEEFPGQGIGLTTVQRIIARHGGQVWGKAERGTGASFHFTLWSDPALLADAQEGIEEA